ncbi:hypothetical protein [Paenibacillus lautus]|nr:hypothetical protein [Paenibacillus lautus]
MKVLGKQGDRQLSGLELQRQHRWPVLQLCRISSHRHTGSPIAQD